MRAFGQHTANVCKKLAARNNAFRPLSGLDSGQDKETLQITRAYCSVSYYAKKCLIIFGLKVLVVEKKRPVFFLQICFYLSNRNKNNNHVYKKQHFFVIFGFFGVKNSSWTKSQILHAKTFFSQKFIFEHKNKFATKKGIKIFNLKFVFLLIKKCISYNFHK